MNSPQERTQILNAAVYHLSLSLEFGFLKMLTHPEVTPLPQGVSPLDRVIREKDLKPIFDYYPFLSAEIATKHAITWVTLTTDWCTGSLVYHVDTPPPASSELG